MSELMFFLKTLNPNKKPANKVEPKFKIGDWVVYDGWVCQIIDVTEDGYCNSEHGFIPQGREDSMRLWTIEDAKDGDVLVASDGSIFLFAGVVDCACKYYAALTPDNYFKVNKEAKGGYWETSRAVHPATKAQRDTLEKAMTDAGYTFDFEKKELKKIIVPIFNIGDTIAKKHNSDIHDFGSFVITDITGGKYWYNDRIICDITEQDEWELYEPVRQNSTAWSEEDEEMYKEVLTDIIYAKNNLEAKGCLGLSKRAMEAFNWFSKRYESFRPQSQWKPSKEQMKALWDSIPENVKEISARGMLLDSLYQDLKKL